MNKTTEVFESKNSNYSSTKVERALKLAEEALNAMLTHMGMDEDEWTKPTFNQAREALAAIREVLAEPVCEHRIADARNEFVRDGYICIKCGALFRAADHAETVKQEPVAEYLGFSANLNHVFKLDADIPVGTKLYAAPVSTEAIRAEALEEAAKVCESMIGTYLSHERCASAIRSLK